MGYPGRVPGRGAHGGKTWGTLVSVVAVLLWLSSGVSWAQTRPDTVESLAGIEIETVVDRAEMFIGDLVLYELVITYDSAYELVPPPLGANLGAFDVKDYEADVITRLPDGRVRSESRFVLSTFTTGDYVIPPIPVVFNLPDGGKKVLLSESVPIKVNSLIENESDSADIRPLKAPYEFERNMARYYFWGALILVVSVIAAVLIWRRYRRRRRDEEEVDTRPPWEIAFEKLAMLKERNLVRDGLFKQYYVELTEIARAYLGRVYSVDVMEKTTEEFLVSFEEISLPGDLYEKCREFLNHGDLVKFAKHVPERQRAERDLDMVHDMVESVRSQRERQAVAVDIASADSKSDDVTVEARS